MRRAGLTDQYPADAYQTDIIANITTDWMKVCTPPRPAFGRRPAALHLLTAALAGLSLAFPCHYFASGVLLHDHRRLAPWLSCCLAAPCIEVLHNAPPGPPAPTCEPCHNPSLSLRQGNDPKPPVSSGRLSATGRSHSSCSSHRMPRTLPTPRPRGMPALWQGSSRCRQLPLRPAHFSRHRTPS